MRLIAFLSFVSLSWASALPDRSVLTKQETDVITPETGLLTGEELADYINKHQQLFKGEPRADIELLKRKVMKSKYISRNNKPREDDTEIGGLKIPDSFDARVTWPHCPSISYIRDQSLCGSCWAISSAEVMSDRVCITSHGHKKVELSADDILSCCTDGGYGCDGGYLYAPWKYFIETGVVTGGLYGTKDACRPYEISPYGIHKNETFYNNHIQGGNTPACNTTCQAGYPISYDKDKTYGKTSYNVSHSVSAIQREILTNGPVVAGFIVYDDFYLYKSGIYKHTFGDEDGGHAVRILGWGEEGGVPYWLIANSWNTDWGENGYFRMLRGTNECGIEENVVAGQV